MQQKLLATSEITYYRKSTEEVELFPKPQTLCNILQYAASVQPINVK